MLILGRHNFFISFIFIFAVSNLISAYISTLLAKVVVKWKFQYVARRHSLKSEFGFPKSLIREIVKIKLHSGFVLVVKPFIIN